MMEGYIISFLENIEKFGLQDLKGLELFNKAKPSNKIHPEQLEKIFDINDYVFEKTYSCPVCDKQFQNTTIRVGKMQTVAIDYDLRPIFKEPIQPLFYDIISCNHCGYSSISQKFSLIGERQAQKILDNITPKFKPITYPLQLTLDMAIERYQLALLNAIIKKSKDGEKAYICMKLAWLYRSKRDGEHEKAFIRMSYEGFTSAYQNEGMPICGLDEHMIMYLLAAFAKTLGLYSDSLKLLSNIIISKSVSSRLKERARDLKDAVNIHLKKEPVSNESLA